MSLFNNITFILLNILLNINYLLL